MMAGAGWHLPGRIITPLVQGDGSRDALSHSFPADSRSLLIPAGWVQLL